MGGRWILIYIRSRNRHSNRQYDDSGYRDFAKYNIYYFIRQKGKYL